MERKYNEEKQTDQMYCGLYSGVGLKRLGDGWAVRGKEGGEMKEGSLVQGCHNLGGRGRAGGRGGMQQGAALWTCCAPGSRGAVQSASGGKGGSLPHSR